MTAFLGDFNPSDVFNTKFCTVTSSGAPDTFTTSPAVVVYKDSSTVSTTAGITLVTNFNSVTGLNNLTIDTSASATFYASGHDFMAVISAGQAGGVTISGYVVAEFSIQHRSALRSTTSGRTLNVSAGGLADANVIQINSITASAVTTVNANIGTTQPVNFTGTAGSAIVKSDVIDWNSAAVVAPNVAGIPLVDVKYFLGTLSAGAAGYAGIDWGHIAAPTTTVDLSGTTIAGLDAAGYNASADALLARNVAGGSSTGRVVKEAFYVLRNLWTVNTSSGVYSVYQTDDTTVAWTSSLTTNAAAVPITGSDPA